MKKLLFLLAFFLFATTTFAQYIIDGNRYKRPSSNGSAIFTYTNCTEATAGTMVTGAAVNGVTQTISINVTNAGTYNLSATANGVTFAGTGTVAIGNQTIVLTASGTPIALGDYNFTINTTPLCTFSRTTSAPNSTTNGTAVVSSYTCTTASAGNLIIGTPAFGVTQTITAEVTTAGSYVISATANGVTFLGTGTVAVGTQNIVLTATGTPAALATHNFTLNTTPNCSFSQETLKQVLVSGAVTGNGRYATLAAAFTAINGGIQTGRTISISVEGNTNETATSASLNAGVWTSLTITPVGPRTITGATTAGTTLINLNGADNVTINGLNTDGNSLTLTNTTVSATPGTATLRFIADASTNTITNCTIAGSSTLATSGTIFFSTGTTTGNDGNTISNCAIIPAGLNLPVNAIYSAGSSTTVDNSGNTIDNNTIQDYFSPTVSSAGIMVNSFGSAWIIKNNKLFQTATRTVTTNGLTIRGIVLFSGLANYILINNVIGFANALGTGTTIYNGAFTTLYRGIEINTNNNESSSIQGNIIAGINFTSTNLSTGTTGNAGIFSGINITQGLVNIGTTTGNTIGSSNTANSIVVTGPSGSTSRITGIYSWSTSNSSYYKNNTIGGISTGANALSGYSFIGIYTDGNSNLNISNNLIGSNTHINSIVIGNALTSTACVFRGTYNTSSGTIILDNNKVVNTAVFGLVGSSFNGIVNSGGSAVVINSNLVSNASVIGTGGNSFGLINSAPASTLSINNNTIRNYSISNTTGAFTAISNSGAITSAINIDNNKLGDALSGLVTYTVTNSGGFSGISNTGGTSAATLSIQNNDIIGINHPVAVSSIHNYLINSAATLSQNISGNTFTNLSVNTIGAVTFISNNVALPAGGVQTIINNSIVTGFAKTGASGNVTIFTTGATSNASASINNLSNNFSNITVAGTSAITGWNQSDLGSTTKTVSNNIFSNWTAGSGAIIVMNLTGFGNTSAIANNTISSITGQVAITGLNLGSAGTATALNINGNSITGLSSIGIGGAVVGLASVNNSPVVNIYSNHINTLSSGGASVAVTGISVTGGTGITSVYTNKVNNLSGTGNSNATAFGINIAGGTTVNVYKNKIYGLAENGVSSAVVNGINITGGTNVTCSNNIIGDLKAPNASRADAVVRGIVVNSSAVNSNYSLYYNTVYLNATSNVANFTSWGLYHLVSGTATMANLTLNNNVIINNSIAKGTGKTVAYARSNAALDNYNASSNNNLFYAGIPSSSNVLLLANATNYSTLTDFQNFILSRESNSVTENVTFLSTIPSNVNYLKPDATVASIVESSGANIAGFTNDYEDVIRQGNASSTSTGTAPDLGAFEQEGIVIYKPIVVTGATTGNGNYTTLGSAFMAINQGSQTGTDIAISINDNTVETTGIAQLNAGTWNLITITPNGNRTISGQMLPGSPLINLDGADNVTINGLNTGGNSLTLANTTVSNSSGTSTIRFINDASNNTITNCTISGSSTLAASGTIFFSTGSTTGNDGNTISNCAITPAGSNLPAIAIYSAGTSTVVDNSGNTIHNNAIQDYFSPTISSAGIALASNSGSWTITNNKLFETATRVTTNGIAVRGIVITTTSAGGYTINNNTIGFANASGTGTTIYVGAFTTNYRGIELSANTTVSNIQGNTIAGINFTTSNTGTNNNQLAFSGISVYSGSVNIGTTTGNTIGSSTVLSSIVINSTSTTNSAIIITGINVASAGATSVIQNNSIGGFSTGTGATLLYSFGGIRCDGALGNFTITNNTIGSTTLANSITMGDSNTTSRINFLGGIYNTASGNIIINNNTVMNTALFGSNGVVSGIANYGGSEGSTITINGNLIANISISGEGGYYSIIRYASPASTLSIRNNTIRNFSIKNSTGYLEGIFTQGSVTSSVTLDNNKLGDALGGLVTFLSETAARFHGIINFAGTTAAALSIQNNNIQEIVNSVVGSGGQTYISNGATTFSQNISGNTFTNLTANTTGGITFIFNRVGLPAGGVQNINNNSIVTGFAKTGAGGVITLLLADAVSNPTATIINTGNNFSNMTISGASNFLGWQNNSASTCSRTISNNVFENWTVGSGDIQVLEVADNGINKTNVFNNTIKNINALGGAIRGIFLRSNGGVLNCYGNSITNLYCFTTTASARLEAIRFQTFLTGTSDLPNNINNNTINNIYHTGGNGDNSTRGIVVLGETNNSISIFNNTISNVWSDGTGNHQLYGLLLSYSKNGKAYNNKIFNITSNGASSPTSTNVIGLSVELIAGNNWNIYNNLISDLKAPNTANTNQGIVGLVIPDNSSGGLCNFYHNTIHLNATSTGSDFGTAAIYHGNGETVLDMRNNILVNNSTATGTGKTTVLMRSPSGTSYGTTYAASSNNNLFYAGVPSATNILLSPEGTTITQTLAALKTNLTPRESNTTSGAVSFLSLDGTSNDFLRPDFTNAATSALIDNKGTSLSSVTTDFAGVTRGTVPDIGAYEFFGTTSAVVETYACNTALTGTMEVGVPVSGVTQTITAMVTAVGTYTISAIANGVTFAGTGTFIGTGTQEIVLTATGTPLSTGTHTFTLNTTPNCSFYRITQ